MSYYYNLKGLHKCMQNICAYLFTSLLCICINFGKIESLEEILLPQNCKRYDLDPSNISFVLEICAKTLR